MKMCLENVRGKCSTKEYLYYLYNWDLFLRLFLGLFRRRLQGKKGTALGDGGFMDGCYLASRLFT